MSGTDEETTPHEPRKLSLRSRVLWWMMVRCERAAGWCRREVIRIWRGRMEKKRRAQQPVMWEAWYLGDDRSCLRCGIVDENAGQLSSCPECGYAGRRLP